MQVILRLTVLGTFAAAGVALAISVAANTRERVAAKHDVAAESASAQAPSPSKANVDTKPSVAAVPQAGNHPKASNAASPFPASAPPLIAAYEPRIASRLDSVLAAIDRVQSQQSQTAFAVAQLQQRAPLPAPLPIQATPSDAGEEELPAESNLTTQVTIDPKSKLIDIVTQNDDIRDVLEILGEAGSLNILVSPKVEGEVSASLRQVTIEKALTALLKSKGLVFQRDDDIIYVGTAEELQGMTHVAEEIDTKVYHPNYVSAAELQTLITPLLSTDVGRITVSSPPTVGIAANATDAGGNTFSGNDVVMVRDYVTILDEIDQLVAKVDLAPLQVAIEATILSVKLGDKETLGVDFELLRNKDTIRVVSGTPLDSLATASFKDGLKVGFLDSSLFAFINALETIGETSVVASPRVMCLNKQKAEILIGSELGYVNTTVTATAAIQSVEFLEVGTKLIIRPYISGDGRIRMEVHPELSTGSVRVQEGFTLPDKEVTQVTTNIMCFSESTVVIGGLIREDLVTSSTQIPVLGKLPLVGPVFQQHTEDIDRHEILVLLTPRIVSDVQLANEGHHSAEQARNRRQVIADKMSPIGTRHIGEQYSRLAVAAYNAGDLDTALRYANLAIQFDPFHQGAIDLRAEILKIDPTLEVGVKRNLRHGLAPWEHPTHDYSLDGVPWQLTEPPAGEPLQLHINDVPYVESQEFVEPAPATLTE